MRVKMLSRKFKVQNFTGFFYENTAARLIRKYQRGPAWFPSVGISQKRRQRWTTNM
jgi:hypothetical protein